MSATRPPQQKAPSFACDCHFHGYHAVHQSDLHRVRAAMLYGFCPGTPCHQTVVISPLVVHD